MVWAIRARSQLLTRLPPPSIRPPLISVSCRGSARTRQFSASVNALYISDWFIEVRKVVETVGRRRFILSRWFRRVVCSCASEVWKALENYFFGVGSVVFFAGRRYREHLEPRLRDCRIEVQVPMEGLVMGEQLAWLKRRTDRR